LGWLKMCYRDWCRWTCLFEPFQWICELLVFVWTILMCHDVNIWVFVWTILMCVCVNHFSESCKLVMMRIHLYTRELQQLVMISMRCRLRTCSTGGRLRGKGPRTSPGSRRSCQPCRCGSTFGCRGGWGWCAATSWCTAWSSAQSWRILLGLEHAWAWCIAV
jgi:hypothetical protein